MSVIDPAIEVCITHLHSAGRKLVFEFAGAGSLALFWLHAVPGSSRTVLEATDRYSAATLTELLGTLPEQAVAAQTARAMAEQAYRRAMRLSGGLSGCLGVACTAAIATDRERRGANRCWVALRDRHSVTTYALTLVKGLRDRVGEEETVSRLVLRAVAEASNVPAPPISLAQAEQVVVERIAATDPIADLLDGTIPLVLVSPQGQVSAAVVPEGAILSGSFHPLHAGHERLAQAAALALHMPVTFELTVVNADKPGLNYAEIEQRLAQFRGRYAVALSRAPLFVEKAALYPGRIFVVGYDTAARLIDPGYYGSIDGRNAALETIRGSGCRFLVAGRAEGALFCTLADIAIPQEFASLFSALPERAFRVDLSSTEIRAALAPRPV